MCGIVGRVCDDVDGWDDGDAGAVRVVGRGRVRVLRGDCV